MCIRDMPWIPFVFANQYEAMRNNVKGYTLIPTGSNIAFRETWIEA